MVVSTNSVDSLRYWQTDHHHRDRIANHFRLVYVRHDVDDDFDVYVIADVDYDDGGGDDDD